MGLGGAYSYLIRTASAEQIELIVARREHAKQLNDLEAKHDAALVALRQELAAAHAAVKSLRAVNDACRRRLQECDAAMQESCQRELARRERRRPSPLACLR
jgi:hypothetical protein